MSDRGRSNAMRSWFRSLSFLLLVACSLGDLGLLGEDVYPILSLFAFLLFMLSFRETLGDIRRPRSKELFFFVLLIAAGLFAARLSHAGIVYLYLFVAAGISLLLHRAESEEAGEFFSFTVALSLVAAAAELSLVFPIVWHAKFAVAGALSKTAELIGREERNLGPTAMGLPLLASLVFLEISRGALSLERSLMRSLRNILVLLLIHIAYLVALRWYAYLIANRAPHLEWFLLDSQHLFILIGSATFVLLDRGRHARPLGKLPATSMGAIAMATLVGAVAAFLFGLAPAPEHRRARIMLYDRGYVNWRVPVHGFYGEYSAGMFGMLPPLLRAVGFQVVVSDDIELLDRPDRPDVLVMINIQEYLDPDEKRIIYRFIRGGGGLLCLGDHTGVAGIRGPFNDLLAPLGIRFRFDSSTFLGEGWNDALELRPHPMNRGVRNAEDLLIWVGATLDISLGAAPIIVGRYGYSDWGNPANIERSFLGDRKYNPNELLGDLVLVAEARFGSGKIVVFGDTSGYQNLSFSQTLDAVARSFDYLASGDSWRIGPVAALLIILAGILLATVLIGAGRFLLLLALVSGMGIGSALSDVASGRPKTLIPDMEKALPHTVEPGSAGWDRIAYLDISHGGRITLRGWEKRSITGLLLNLFRYGYFPRVRSSFPAEELRSADLLLVLSPTRGYRASEIERLERFLEDGGRMIVCTGYEELDGSRALLEHFGLTIDNKPLGRFTVPVPRDTAKVDFYEAWPVIAGEESGTETILSLEGDPLIVRRTVGRGEILVVGDSFFLCDDNLEALKSYHPGNIAFLGRLIGRGTR